MANPQTGLVVALLSGALAMGCGSSKPSGTGGQGGTGATATSSSSSSSSSGVATGGGGPGGASTSSSTSSGSGDPCAGVTCSGHGTCSAPGGPPTCACAAGYHSIGADCAADETCAGKSCGTCGMCEVAGGVASCVCPQDYAWSGSDCVLAIDPCATANCQADEYCVPEAHCQALGACVPTCDCSNCPNCSPDNSDGKWDDWQEYCGAPINQSPATMACNKPCPDGQGCLPYATQICWPIEGCFSL